MSATEISSHFAEQRVVKTVTSNHLRNVALLGAIGGALSWACNYLWLGHVAHVSAWIDPVISTGLGAGAGVIYVFLLANTDRGDGPRLLALALLAGFFWEPVLQAGSALIERQMEQETIGTAQAEIEEAILLARGIAAAPREQQPALIDEIARKLNDTAVLAAQIESVSGLQRISAATEDLVRELEVLSRVVPAQEGLEGAAPPLPREGPPEAPRTAPLTLRESK
jgi:hypothetical protein